MLGKIHETEERRCPKCAKLFDRASGVGHDDPPEPGDVTVCIECHSVLMFDERLTMRTPTAGEVEAMKASGVWPIVERTVETLKKLTPR